MFCKYRQVLLVLASSAALVSCDRLITPDFETSVAELRGGQYTLDKEHATLLWKIDHLGFSRYIGRFDDFDATLDFDAENVENSSLEVIIDTASLDVNNEAFAEDLRGDDWFDVANHPQAVFRTTAFVEAVDEDTFVFDGDLTLLGNTGPVTMTVNFNGGGRNFLTRRYTLGFSATAEFLRSDFGLDNMVSFGVGDEIQIEVHVEFQDSSL
ncbi:MAG TPA: polyisoprenoid-binding protein [Pseudohongiella sp.]|nr:polyisoprenoid-binding protein [Pseudohongiella sp.]HEA63199.1 polyisoprenoid-binding protein [Pseudohongiella sp.]